VPALLPLAEQSAWPASDLPEAEPEPVWVEPEPEPMPLEPAPMPAEVAEPEPEPEPVLAEVPAPEPEPVHAEPEPEPEPVLAEVPAPEPEPIPYRPLRPISDTLLRVPRAPDPEAIAAAEANEESLAARRAQLDELGLGEAEQGPIGRTRPVLLPYRSSGAAPHPADAHAAVAGGVTGPAFWDASAREVAGAVTPIGVRSCGQCELSISATARFCRRCGTPQAQSA
jgi:hypothetical protein